MSNKNEVKKQRFKEKHSQDLEASAIKEEIIAVLKTQKPFDVRSLVKIISEKKGHPQENIIQVVKDLERNNELILREPPIDPVKPPKKIRDYFFARNFYAYEFWLTIAFMSLALTLILIDVRTGFLFYLRYVVVCIFMLFITGWALTSVIYPELDEKLTFLERVTTAIGLSLFVMLLDALFLNYTFRFSPESIVISLIVFVLIFMIISIGLRVKLAKDGFILKKKNDEKEVIEK
ncbi:MAG: DUF1616 domain-containing protein [Asgard group archaeon]|nr:DUF1616 domain-containing protein [Asgard group archaeon]